MVDNKFIYFGIMCDSLILNKFQFNVIKKILKLKNTKLALLIINDIKEDNSIKKSHDSNYFLYNFFNHFIRKPKSFEKVNLTKFFSEIPKIKCQIELKKKHFQYFQLKDIEKIKKYNLDFILKFGFKIIQGDILKSAKYGIWSYDFDDELKYREYPSFFWEIYNNDDITIVTLQRLHNKSDGGVVLKRGRFKTINFSLYYNRRDIYDKITKWPAQVCIDIINGYADYLNHSQSKTETPIYKKLNNRIMTIFLLKLLNNKINFIKKKKVWNIGICFNPIESFLKKDFKPKIYWINHPPKNEFYADPFGIKLDDEYYIFFELFYRRLNLGRIAYIKIDKENNFSLPKKVLNLPYHLAYPYIFKYQNEIYCIPETRQIKQVNLFKAIEFPNKWEKVKTLLNHVILADNTLIKYNSRWWLFSNPKSSTLNLYYSKNLFGDWKPHYNNPVKQDIASSRPGGTPFIHNNTLYRPSQDCTRFYGGRIKINRIDVITPKRFKETVVKTISPIKNSPYPDMIHTISSIDDITVIDSAARKPILNSINIFNATEKIKNYILRK
ncbi:MAG: hypothetical protein ACFFAH_00365 [Promethearchaeota archaeon]